MDRRLDIVYRVLRIGLGLGAFIAGLDKFFNVLTDWSMYLSPIATRIVPVSDTAFMRVVGVVEMLVGLLILSGICRVGGYLMMLWLLGIAANLVTTRMYYDLAMRDVEISIAAFALARLATVRKDSSETTSASRTEEGA